MRKTSVLLILAITLSCAFAAYQTKNFNKSPQAVADDSELSFVNSSVLTLTHNADKFYLASFNATTAKFNSTTDDWDIWLREIKTDTLAIGENINATVDLTPEISIHQNIAYSIAIELDSIPQIRVYQQSILGGAPFPRLQLTNNKDSSFIPEVLATVPLGNVVYVFYHAAKNTINVTSFEIGGSMRKKEFTLTSNYFMLSLHVATGKALTSGAVYAVWLENTGKTLKEAVIDLSTGDFTATDVAGYQDDMGLIKVFVTDGYVYGGIFAQHKSDSDVFFIKSNVHDKMTPLTNSSSLFSKVVDVYPYGEHFVLMWEDVNLTSFLTTISYEIWNGDASGIYQPKTEFLSYDSDSEHFEYLVPDQGIYCLVYDKSIYPVKLITNVKVGQVLESSYLTVLLNFIIAVLGLILLI